MKLKKLLSEIGVEQMKVYSNPYATAFKPIQEDETQKKVKGIDESINESIASLIDQIRQDSKDVKDFVKNIFKDSEFKKMRNDKEFIKYLKSIYEGVNEAKAFVVMFKAKKDLPNRNVKPSSAAYSKEVDAKKFLKSVENDGGKGMIVKSNVSGMKVEAKDAEVYHKSYTHAIEAAQNYAGKNGYTIEDGELFTKVAMNSKRPSVGKTTRVSLELLKNGKPQRKMLHIQVYGMKNGYELNAYIN
jgi:hypothetical protein